MAGDKGLEIPKVIQSQIDQAERVNDFRKRSWDKDKLEVDKLQLEKQSIDPNAFARKRGPSAAFASAIGRARESVARALGRSQSKTQNNETQGPQSEE